MTEELQYPFEDLIISRTDGRGVIQAANEAFKRIAGYDADELIGAPHKILRHPDMPKGVFYAIWAELLAGRPVGGYVKNRAKSGDYYWVFATISPIEGGFISMRIRPSIGSLERTRILYSRMLKREQEQGFTPEQSAGFMLEVLAKNGYPDYMNFMASRLAKELLARDRELGRPVNGILSRLDDMMPYWKDVGEECSKVFEAYATFGEVPSNLRLQARNLNEIGASLGAVAVNFTTIADKIAQDLEKYSANFDKVNLALSRCLFLNAAQSLLEESIPTLEAEGSRGQEIDILRVQADAYRTSAAKEIDGAVQNFNQFLRGSKRIKRDFTGLSMTRVMCAIETAKVPHGRADHIRSIISELDRFQGIGDNGLDKICDNLEKIEYATEDLEKLIKNAKHSDMKLAS